MDKYAYLITNRLGMACPMASSPERLVEWCLTPGTEHEDGAQQPPEDRALGELAEWVTFHSCGKTWFE